MRFSRTNMQIVAFFYLEVCRVSLQMQLFYPKVTLGMNEYSSEICETGGEKRMLCPGYTQSLVFLHILRNSCGVIKTSKTCTCGHVDRTAQLTGKQKHENTRCYLIV